MSRGSIPGDFFLRFSAGVLTTLDLGGNYIRAEGAAAIAEALRGNGALTILLWTEAARGIVHVVLGCAAS